MVNASCVRLDHSLHFELEQEGEDRCHGQPRLDGDGVLPEVVGGFQELYDAHLVVGEVGKELALNAVSACLHQFLVVGPPHGVHEIGCRGDEPRTAIAYEPVAALAVRGAHGTRERKHIAVIFLSDACGDKATALRRTLHKDGGVAQTRRDAVAPHEVDLVGLRVGHILGDKPTMRHHLVGRVAMALRIEGVEAMGQHRHRVHLVGQGIAVCMNVDPIGQSAHNERIGTAPPQVGHKTPDQVLAIGRAVARANNIDDPPGVEVGRSPIEQRKRRVGRFLQPARVERIVEA